MKLLLLLLGVFLVFVSIDATIERKRSGPHDHMQKRGDPNIAQVNKRGDKPQAQKRHGPHNQMRENLGKPNLAQKRDDALVNPRRGNQPNARPNAPINAQRGIHRRSDELPHEVYSDGRSIRSFEENAVERPRKSTEENGVSRRQDYIYPPYYPPYYTETMCDICCDGKKFVGEFPLSESCCGSKPFDTNGALCCDNVVVKYDISNPYYYQLACCGTCTYNTTTELCCGNRAVKKAPFEQCCGDQTFNVKEKVCCGTTIYDRPAYDSWGCCLDKLYDTSKEQCMEEDTCDTITPGELPYQCGMDTIDFNMQICCNDMPVDRVDNYTLCCGNAGYQSNEYICCGTQTYKDDKTGTQECCGDMIICTLTETCCDNTAVTLPTGPDCGDYYCCGKQLYNYDTQICCIDSVYDMPADYYGSYSSYSSYYPYYYPCCGNKLFDQYTQTCCDTTVVDGYYARCCGDSTYDSNSQTCCNNTLYNIGELSADTCCDCTCSYYYPGPIVF